MSVNDNCWQGRVDEEDGAQGLRWHQRLKQPGQHGRLITLVGFASDLGVKHNKGRIGAQHGPDGIRRALSNLAWHSQADLADLGNIEAKDDLEQAQQKYAAKITQAINSSSFTIGLGGGHEIAWGTYQGLNAACQTEQPKRIGIINFDAHFDLRKPAPHTSSGTPFWQIAQHCNASKQDFHYACLGVAKSANTEALFERARSTGTKYLLDHHCTVSAAKHLLTPMLEEIDALYVTICLDAFPAAIAPGVSAPSAVGISPHFVIAILYWLAQQQKELGYQWQVADIAELNPQLDIDQHTAKLAARMVFELVEAQPGEWIGS